MSRKVKVLLLVWGLLFVAICVCTALGDVHSHARFMGDYPGTLPMVTFCITGAFVLLSPIAFIAGVVSFFRWILGPRKIEIVHRS